MAAQFPTITKEQALMLIQATAGALPLLLNWAGALTDSHKGNIVTYARKVFISPVHHLNANYTCCQEEQPMHKYGLCLLTRKEIMNLAQYGKQAGCKEAVFTSEQMTGEEQALIVNWLTDMGYRSFSDYLAAMCQLVFDEFQLVPNPDTYGMNYQDLATLRPHSGSLTVTLRLVDGVKEHQHSLDRVNYAGQQHAPLTVVLPIGRGESAPDRVQALFDLAQLQAAFGHIQEVVVQNSYLEAGRQALLDTVRTVAIARLVLGGDMNLQARSVLTSEAYELCMIAGVNDWGGVIVDNPHLPNVDWTKFDSLSEQAKNVGLSLCERYPIHANMMAEHPEYIAPKIYEHVRGLLRDTGMSS